MEIPFNHLAVNQRTLAYLSEVVEERHLSGDGPFTARFEGEITHTPGSYTLLSHLSTAALELPALIAPIGPGDNGVLPSYSFFSTAIAAEHGLFVLEDAAQALLYTYKGREADTLSSVGALSFLETKNIVAGEGARGLSVTAASSRELR